MGRVPRLLPAVPPGTAVVMIGVWGAVAVLGAVACPELVIMVLFRGGAAW